MRRPVRLDRDSPTHVESEHVAGREDRSRQLWGLLAFTLWYERHVERTPVPLREARLAEVAAEL